MEDNIEIILVGPGEKDLPIIKKLASNTLISLVAVVTDDRNPAASWCTEQGIPRYDEMGAIRRLLPGQLLLILDEDYRSSDMARNLAARGFSVMGRTNAALLAEISGRQTGEGDDFSSMVRGFHRLFKNYSPTTRQTTTEVKLSACLTEAVLATSSDGGALLTGVPKGTRLSLACQAGGNLSQDTTVDLDEENPTARCYLSGQAQLVDEPSPDRIVLLPGIGASSAVCLPVKSGPSIKGVMVVWSNAVKHFDRSQLEPLSVFSCFAATVLEMEELLEQMEENLLIDPLTGLFNRRQFEQRLNHEVRRAQRYSLNLSLLVFDIDRFRDYNDSCGHLMGNLALSDLASMTRTETREVDFVARVGDDEFAVILPETSRLGALRLANRLREEIADYPFPAAEEKDTARLTITGGIASHPSNADNEREILARAYRALEEAKKKGPNNISLEEE